MQYEYVSAIQIDQFAIQYHIYIESEANDVVLEDTHIRHRTSDNKLHNIYHGAYLVYYSNRKLVHISYYICNTQHRLFRPSLITYNQNGNISAIEYTQFGKLHNEFGPAFISLRSNGVIDRAAYYLNGEHCSKIDLQKA